VGREDLNLRPSVPNRVNLWRRKQLQARVEDDQKGLMTEYVRGAIERILRQSHGEFVCRRCLSMRIRDMRPPLYTPLMVEQAIDEVIETPGALEVVSFGEAKCAMCMGGSDTTRFRAET
jgi:hypothetical protein